MVTLLTKEAAAAAEALRGGGLCAVPTETVYGLAANGMDPAAVEKIYAVKGRPENKPLSLLVPGPEALDMLGRDVPPAAKTLAAAFWPGPLTLVVHAAPFVPEIVRAGGETVGLRCPDHPLTLELLRSLELPLAAPSANPSGAPSPVNARQVLDYFDGKIDCVLDGGECGLGRASTIVDMTQTPYRVLRQGALPEADIRAALREKLTVVGITGGTGGGKTTALREIQARGGLVLDCDEIYHGLLESSPALLGELEAEYPEAFAGGAFDRKALGRIVFADEKKLLRLNEITHRHVAEAVEQALSDFAMSGGRLAAVDAIALIESGIAERCTTVVGVLAPEEARIERLMAREGISREYAKLRIDAQKPDSFFRERCDILLVNDGTKEEFARKCRETVSNILSEGEKNNE